MSRTRLSTPIALSALLALGSACGGGDDDGAGSDGGAGADASPDDPCGFGSDAYLPYAAGFTWTYRLTDLASGERATKEQRLDPETTDPDFGAVLTQVTGKIGGETISLVRKEGDRVLRFRQEDHDETGALQRTTTYDPSQIRIDESEEHTALDAEWDETYTEIETDPAGVETMRIDTIDHWTVLGVDDSCESPMGTFQCIRLRRTRTQGGVAEKEFQFARGIGKIREVGSNQLEELTACTAE